MPITSLAQYLAAPKQYVRIWKAGVTAGTQGVHNTAGSGAGDPIAVASIANTTTGIVPVAGNTGFPAIQSFGGKTGYITKIEYNAATTGKIYLYDQLWGAGPIAFNVAATFTGNPSYAGRIPGGDYKGTEVWLEDVTAFTGNTTIAYTYTDQAGAAKTSNAQAPRTNLTLLSCAKIPSTDLTTTGYQSIQSVTPSVATAGTLNLLVMRPLWSGDVPVNASGLNNVHGIDMTGCPQIFETSALKLYSTATSGIIDMTIEITMI